MKPNLRQDLKRRCDHFTTKTGKAPSRILLGKNKLKELDSPSFQGIPVIEFPGDVNHIQVE